jgi:DNA-directed RNA polymerase subunit omega
MPDNDAMMNPPIEKLLSKTGNSKFALVTLAARRAREVHLYFNQIGGGLSNVVPPQVASMSRKALSIAFEEIAEEKIKSVPLTTLEVTEAPASDS